ncbi:MAG: MFS transporter [Deferribacterales bacterium]
MTALSDNVKLKSFIILLLLVVIMASQFFCAAISILSYQKNFEDMYLSKFRIIELKLVRDIEGALYFGKEINSFLGLGKLLDQTIKDNAGVMDISVYSPDGRKLHGKGTKAVTAEGSVKLEEGYLLAMPMKDASGKTVAVMNLLAADDTVKEATKRIVTWTLQTLILVITSSLLMLLLLLKLFFRHSLSEGFSRGAVAASVIGIVVLSQIVFICLISSKSEHENRAHAAVNAGFIEQSFRKDIEMLLSKGVRISKLAGINESQKKVTSYTPEIGSSDIFDSGMKLLYTTESVKSVSADITDLKPIKNTFGGQNKIDGFIRVSVSDKYLGDISRKLLMDGLTIFVISLMFATELLIFLFAFTRKSVNAAASEQGEPKLMRTAAATYLFASTFAVSFIPLHMKSLVAASGVMSSFSQFLSSLPVSAEITATLPMIFLAGWWMDRRGWQEPFIAGCAVSLMGAAFSAAASDVSSFIFARCVSGAGYGLTWTAAITFVLKNSDNENRSANTASLVAGIITGHISGGAVGAMLAERIGFTAVFWCSAALMTIPLIFTLIFMKSYFEKPHGSFSVPIYETLAQMHQYVSDKRIFAVFTFSIIPYSLCQMGLLLFATPVYLHSLNVSQSNIGRVMMVYGATVVYLSPYIGRLSDRFRHKRRLVIFTGGAIGGISLLIIIMIKGVAAVGVALFLMGISSSILGSTQMVYAYEQEASKYIGTGSAVSLQRTTDKLGQMLGPLILGALFSFTAMDKGLFAVGLLFLLASGIFLFLTSDK